MPQDKVALAITILALMALCSVPRGADAQPAPWIGQTATQEYATNLIDSYNALVASNQASSPNFQTVKQDFSLYHGAGDSFEVLVVKSTTLTIDSNGSDVVAFVFLPIQSSQPQVVVDDNDTLEGLFGIVMGPALNFQESNGHDIISPLKDGTAFFQFNMTQQGKETTVPLIWVTSISHDVLNDTAANSMTAGQEVYNSDSTYAAAQAASVETTKAPALGLGTAIPLIAIAVCVLVFVWARYTGKEPPAASR